MDRADRIAETILDGFDKHYRLFRQTSREAKDRWERRDWNAVRRAWSERIDMYDTRVREAVDAVASGFPDACADESLWPSVKRAYIGLLYEHKQPECAETFFNSVVRRAIERRYYHNAQLFHRPALSLEHLAGEQPTYRCYYPGGKDLVAVFVEVLESFDLACPFQDLRGDAALLARSFEELFGKDYAPHPNFQLQVLCSLFFRNKTAYLVGRVLDEGTTLPFVVPLVHDAEGRVIVDAMLLDAKNLGHIFSLGRAYFMVDMEVPSAYVSFLESVVPRRPRAELYTLVGLQKQGKTLFFRDLRHHLQHSSDRFRLALGTKGMVMVVFTLPSFPYVFKIIRDWFVPPKDADRKHVEERYDFVKKHDRVGRMADTLEYSDVAFPLARFEPELLKELQTLAASCVEVHDSEVVLRHLYVERRLVPLDVYLAKADEGRLREGIREFGNALKDLAGADIFPGDLLLKNFGVTRYGRVVFYDYDELTTLSELRFRTMPTARDDAEEMSADPWFNVEPGDVFPEQFPAFLFAPGKARDIFMEEHGDLARAATWRGQQERLQAGVLEDVVPYDPSLRFSARYGRHTQRPPARPDGV